MAARNLLIRSFWTSLLALIALAVALWFGGRMWLGQTVMSYQGERTLPGLDAPVEVHFDARGIPRVYAGTDADAMRALGWLHAGERLFQLELIRRVSRGTLAELVGEAAIEMDRFNRSFGVARRIAETGPDLDPDTHALVSAYVEGINRKLARSERLGPEFTLLQARPEPWSVEDVISVAYYQSFYATTLVQRLAEAWREIAETHGEPAGRWLAEIADWHRASLPTSRLTEGSNTWTIAPDRSATGSALHAADPHLEYDIAPGMWYAAGLHSDEGLDVVGVTTPGLPFGARGHNGQIAWAFTVAPVDLFEIWRHERDPDDPMRVRLSDGWARMTEHEETFRIDDEREITETFRYTPLGRVIETADDHVLVMQWAGFEQPVDELLGSALAINRAGDFDAFRHAATRVGALSVNWSYSDRRGNIGYVQSTPVPRRRHQHHFGVLDAHDPEVGWDGFHPPESRPFALNPERGWLANANNRAAGEDWPYAIPGFYKNLRIRRIEALLGHAEALEQSDMTRFQLDEVSERALSWKGWLAETAEATGRDRLAEELREWDGRMSAGSETAGLFARWWQYLPRRLFEASGPVDWRDWRVVLDDWLHADELPGTLPDIDRDRAAAEALDDALRAGIRPLGTFQTLTIRHPMSRSGLLDQWLRLSRGPIGVGGDAGSLNVAYTHFDPESASLRARAGASMRYTLDWADPDGFTLNLTLGQSGHPSSPHFDDFLDDFLTGEPWTVPFSRQRVEASSASRLELRP